MAREVADLVQLLATHGFGFITGTKLIDKVGKTYAPPIREEVRMFLQCSTLAMRSGLPGPHRKGKHDGWSSHQ